MRVLFFLSLFALNSFATVDYVTPSYETQAVGSIGDAADDVGIWIDEKNPANSKIIGTDKKAGLIVYSLKGKILNSSNLGKMNNVDFRGDYLVASNRTVGSLDFYIFNPQNLTFNLLVRAKARKRNESYGSCMYKDPAGNIYGTLTYKEGGFEQWKLVPSKSGHILEHVRYVKMNSQTEGCVFDDKRGNLFVTEEERGIWAFDALNPLVKGYLIDEVKNGRPLVADVEGIAIYQTKKGPDYLIASSQGDDTFVFYNLDDNFSFVKKVHVDGTWEIDEVTHTDGLDVTSRYLSEEFPLGIMVVQDDFNGFQNQNFKIISWENILK